MYLSVSAPVLWSNPAQRARAKCSGSALTEPGGEGVLWVISSDVRAWSPVDAVFVSLAVVPLHNRSGASVALLSEGSSLLFRRNRGGGG